MVKGEGRTRGGNLSFTLSKVKHRGEPEVQSSLHGTFRKVAEELRKLLLAFLTKKNPVKSFKWRKLTNLLIARWISVTGDDGDVMGLWTQIHVLCAPCAAAEEHVPPAR